MRVVAKIGTASITDTKGAIERAAIAKLCAEVFGENDWVYQRSDHPSRKNEAHLKNLDRSKLKPFKWDEKEVEAYKALPPRK